MNTIHMLRSLGLAAAILAVGGCATDPTNVESDFGNSVRQMQQAQVANPSAPTDSNAIDHGDGARIDRVIDAYRKDVSDPKDVKKDIDFSVGGSGGK